MSSIIAHPAVPAPPRKLQLTIVFAELANDVAALDGRVLTIDPTCSEAEQVWAATDAVRAILTGTCRFGHKPRHLSVVSA